MLDWRADLAFESEPAVSVLSTFAAAVLATTPAPDQGPMGSPGSDDQANAVYAAYDAAEALQGPLDGLWRLDDSAGHTLFVFDLVDPGGPPAPLSAKPADPGLEGAWRDPSRPREPDASGLIDNVDRAGARLSIQFVQGPRQAVMRLVLTADAQGRWSGELTGDGARLPVVMRRL